MKLLDHKVIKTAIGAALSVYLAQLLKISFGVTAGIVTIITIQSSKRESLKIALERLIASVLGLFLAVILFKLVGFNPVAFGIFLFIFMQTCIYFNLFQGFLATVVLATHMLVSKDVSFTTVLNEVYILILGSVVALALNMYMPNERKKIIKKRNFIDKEMARLLNYFADIILTGTVSINEKIIFKKLKSDIAEYRELALREFNNTLLDECKFELELVNLRRIRYKILNRMRRSFYSFFCISSDHAKMVAKFTRRVAESVDNEEIFEEVLKDYANLKKEFSNMPLPETREEFESRAMFLQFLNELENFLEVQKEFTLKPCE